MIQVTDLKTDKQNPNIMEKRQFEALKKNITEFGFLVPIVTNKDLVIADGEHRWKAAIDLGMQEIPVLRLDVSEIDRRILRQVMNKLRGEHEKTGDISEFMRIYEAGEIEHLKDLLALDQKEMSKIMDSLKVPVEDEAPPVPETTDIKLGDIFQLGEHSTGKKRVKI
jgi:ParB-like chromosome segregation protein Spo0J